METSPIRPAKREGQRDSASWAPPWERLLLFALILLSLGLSLWRIEVKGLWWDESLSLYRAQKSVPYILSGRIDFIGMSTVDQHPPLYFLVLRMLTLVCGDSDFALRIPSALFTTLMIPLLYVLGRRLRNPQAGLWAAFLGSISPFYLWYAQEARMYTMVASLGLASIYCLWRATEERKWTWGLGFSLIASTALVTHYFYAVLLVYELALAFLWWPNQKNASPEGPDGRRRELRRWLWVIALPLPLLFLLTFWVLRSVRLLQSQLGRAPLMIMVRDTFTAFSLGLSIDVTKVWILSLLFLAVFIVGLISLWTRPPDSTLGTGWASSILKRSAGPALLLSSIVLSLITITALSLLAISVSYRYVMIFSPAFYLGLGIGLEAISRRSGLLGALFATVLSIAMLASTYQYHADKRYQVKEDYIAAVRFITRNERPGDAIIVNGPESIPAFRHYYEGRVPIVALPQSGSSAEDVGHQVTNWMQPYDRLWLLEGNHLMFDPQSHVREWLDENLMALVRRRFTGYGTVVSANAYLVRSPIQLGVTQASEPLGIFDGRLALADYTLRYIDESGQESEITAEEVLHASEDGHAVPLQEAIPAGQVVGATFIWQPTAGLRDYKTSLRLVDARGVIWAQYDEPPFANWPTSQWLAGSTIRQDSGLRIPESTPPGLYPLQCVVYRADDGLPLTLRRSTTDVEQGFIGLGVIAVGPADAGQAQRVQLPESLSRPAWGARFGEVELLGYQFGPPAAKGGQDLRIGCYWRAKEAVGGDDELVITLRDSAGKAWYASTHSLTGTDYPTSRWRPGEVLRGFLVISLPKDAPQGMHRLSLSVRRRGQADLLWLQRGPFPWAGHEIVLGKVSVK